MGKISELAQLAASHSETIIQDFEIAAGGNVMTTKFNTRIAQGVTPQEWLDTAMLVGETMGVSAIPYTYSREGTHRISYRLHFNDLARMAKVDMALYGIINSKGAFRIPLFLEPGDNERTIDAYVSSIVAFCSARKIACSFEERGEVGLNVIFDRNVDRMVVRLALNPEGPIGSEIVTFLKGGVEKIDSGRFERDPRVKDYSCWPYSRPGAQR